MQVFDVNSIDGFEDLAIILNYLKQYTVSGVVGESSSKSEDILKLNHDSNNDL